MLSIMKTFLNVLYRRILYKIPLKLLLVLLAIFWLLFACTKASFDNPVLLTTFWQWWHDYSNDDYDLLCLKNVNCSDRQIGFNFAWLTSAYFNSNWNDQWLACTPYWTIYMSVYSNCSVEIYWIKYNDYTSQQCQSEYNLIPINEVDSSYCQSNNLCPSWWTPSDCPNVWVSNLFINDIFHPGAFNIIMNIPEEISRDYAYTNSWYNFNLDIEGYNVDYEKMQSVIDNQSYIPTEEDFQNIISILTPYTKIIVFFVFLFIVWAWIKKPFKSKKL